MTAGAQRIFSTGIHIFLWMSCEPLRHFLSCFSTLNPRMLLPPKSQRRGSYLLLFFDTIKHIYVQTVGWVLRAGNAQPTLTSSWEVDCPLLCGGRSYSTASLPLIGLQTPSISDPCCLLQLIILDLPLAGRTILGQSSDELSLLLFLHL